MQSRKFLALSLFFVIMAWSNPGHAQYQGDAYQTPPPPEADITAGAPPSANGAAATEVRLQGLEDQMRTLNGKIEEQSYQIQQLKEQLEKNNTDIDLRLQAVEHNGAAPADTAAVAPAPAPADTDTTVPASKGEVADLVNGSPPQPATPARQLGTIAENPQTGAVSAASKDQAAVDYESAYALLKANNYDAAEKAFGTFLKKYPGHVLAPNAKYWYGETFYARAQYDKAARVFAEAYQADMKGSKAGDNLLKLGMSLAGMGNKNDACVAFRQLKKEGSKVSGPVMNRADQEMSSLGC